LLDGKLTARERDRLTEHLAGCESCYEIFAGAAHILEDSREEQSQAATPRPFEWPWQVRDLRQRAWWAAAALAAVLAATVGLVVYLWSARNAGPSTEQLASLVGPIASGKIAWGRTMRGGSGSEEPPELLPPEHEAFQLGVRFLDVRLALASGDQNNAAEAVRRLLQLLDRMYLTPPETRAAYAKIQKELPQRPPSPALLAAAATAEKKVMEDLLEEPRLVELGRWTEACRLAGENGRGDLFWEPATLRVLDEAMQPGSKDEGTLDPKALGIVRDIRKGIAGGRIDPAALGKRCTDLLHLLADDDQ
jgi:Putative zinc-finger